MNSKPGFSVRLPSVGADALLKSDEINSPDPPPCTDFTEEELAIYNYLCESLRLAGIDHVTVGLTLANTARLYIAVTKAYHQCEKDGYELFSKNGTPYEAPWSIRYRTLLGLLNQQLPKACLTLPSLARVRKDMGEKGVQDDLFGDLVNHAMSYPGKKLPN